VGLELDRDFEAKAREAMLDDVEATLVGEADPLVFDAIQQSHEALRDFSDQYPGVESVIESLGQPEVERDGDSVTVRWGWDHPAAPFFEFGTSEHTIDGDPVLSFVWEDPPQWVREEFGREGDGWRVFFGSVEVSGIDETRFTRIGLRWLRFQLGGGLRG
jgi:hypothetical protein